MKKKLSLVLALTAAAAMCVGFSACTDEPPTSSVDSSSSIDTSVNSSVDSVIDSSFDSIVDSSIDSTVDSSIDSSVNTPTVEDGVEEKPLVFGVSVTQGEGYLITAENSVAVNGTLTFEVEFDANFDASKAIVTANGVAVTSKDGKYVVENVTENITLSVSGVTRVSYGVMLVSTDGVLLTGASSAKVGESYSFTVTLEEGASKGADFAVKANGVALTSNSDTYTISSVDKDTIITVVGVTVPYYTVSGLTGTGYTVEASATSVIKGKDFSFAVNVDAAYEKSAEYSVAVVGGTLEEKDGVYTVKNVQGDVTITVNGIVTREVFVVTYKNCDLEPSSAYSGTLFSLPTPARSGYLFNGWQDADGNEFVMDYSGDVTVYASWATEDGVDYMKSCRGLVSAIETRYTTLKNEYKLNYLNVDDCDMAAEYLAIVEHFTDFEKSLYGDGNETVNAFLAEIKDVPNVLLKASTEVGVYFENGGEKVAHTGYHGSLALKDATEENKIAFNGSFYSMQMPNPEAPATKYTVELAKFNFKENCETYGRVSMYMKGNYAGMSLLYGEKLLFKTKEQHTLLRVDIQDGYLYLNGTCLAQLDEKVYTGEEDFVLTVLRSAGSEHYYAQWDFSNVYAGTHLDSYSKEVQDGPTLKSVRDNIFSNVNTGEAADAPAEIADKGAQKVYSYTYTAWANAPLDDVALGEYAYLKFYIKGGTDLINLYKANSSTAIVYFDKLREWTEISLVRNGASYDLYVNGAKSTAGSGITNLNQLAFNGTAQGGVAATITYSNLIAEV